MNGDWNESYPAFVMNRSDLHRDALLAAGITTQDHDRHRRIAEQSLADQRNIEAADQVDFETFRRQYLGQDLLCCG